MATSRSGFGLLFLFDWSSWCPICDDVTALHFVFQLPRTDFAVIQKSKDNKSEPGFRLPSYVVLVQLKPGMKKSIAAWFKSVPYAAAVWLLSTSVYSEVRDMCAATDIPCIVEWLPSDLADSSAPFAFLPPANMNIQDDELNVLATAGWVFIKGTEDWAPVPGNEFEGEGLRAVEMFPARAPASGHRGTAAAGSLYFVQLPFAAAGRCTRLFVQLHRAQTGLTWRSLFPTAACIHLVHDESEVSTVLSRFNQCPEQYVVWFTKEFSTKDQTAGEQSLREKSLHLQASQGEKASADANALEDLQRRLGMLTTDLEEEQKIRQHLTTLSQTVTQSNDLLASLLDVAEASVTSESSGEH
jgi:hypothetical protein